MLRFEDVSYTYPFQDSPAVSHISLHVKPGEVVLCTGASGCGKSTLLRLILGLDEEYEGRILLNGQPIDGTGLERGIVFQDHRLFPWLNVEQNVAVALKNSPLSTKEKRDTVREHIELVGLQDFIDAYPHQISGGQRQRTALARSCIPQPRWLLLDEPFSALDPDLRHQMRELVADVQQELKIPMLMISHDLADTQALADEVIRMEDGILQYDRVEIR